MSCVVFMQAVKMMRCLEVLAGFCYEPRDLVVRNASNSEPRNLRNHSCKMTENTPILLL